jgi:hypothetical protein
MISQRIPIIHGWRQCSVGCQAFSGTLWGRRALHRPLWAAAVRTAASVLGKALVWEQAAGSDGQACASCHFNAGADSRTRNQLNPGFRAIPSQTQVGAMPPQQTTGHTPHFTADYLLRASDFPFTQFTDRTSGIVSDTQAVASSQGVFNSDFSDITPTLCPPDQPFLGTICDKAPANPAGNGAILPDRCAADAGAECGFRQREQADNNSSM